LGFFGFIKKSFITTPLRWGHPSSAGADGFFTKGFLIPRITWLSVAFAIGVHEKCRNGVSDANVMGVGRDERLKSEE
jgi:hypothetical protein